MENREVTFGAFLDIVGAFDSTSLDIIPRAAKWHGLGDMICQWIIRLLGGRKIAAMLAGETLERSLARCYPQGAILSPLLWGLVDKLIGGLNENSFYTVGCADDTAIVFSAEST